MSFKICKTHLQRATSMSLSVKNTKSNNEIKENFINVDKYHLSSPYLHILNTIHTHQNQDSVFFISMKDTAERFDCCTRTVRNHYKEFIGKTRKFVKYKYMMIDNKKHVYFSKMPFTGDTQVLHLYDRNRICDMAERIIKQIYLADIQGIEYGFLPQDVKVFKKQIYNAVGNNWMLAEAITKTYLKCRSRYLDLYHNDNSSCGRRVGRPNKLVTLNNPYIDKGLWQEFTRWVLTRGGRIFKWHRWCISVADVWNAVRNELGHTPCTPDQFYFCAAKILYVKGLLSWSKWSYRIEGIKEVFKGLRKEKSQEVSYKGANQNRVLNNKEINFSDIPINISIENKSECFPKKATTIFEIVNTPGPHGPEKDDVKETGMSPCFPAIVKGENNSSAFSAKNSKGVHDMDIAKGLEIRVEEKKESPIPPTAPKAPKPEEITSEITPEPKQETEQQEERIPQEVFDDFAKMREQIAKERDQYWRELGREIAREKSSKNTYY